jgi:hypothetical protein
MGTKQQILNGARCQLLVNGKIQGVFTSVTWGVSYDAVPSYILGRFSPAEITYVGQEAINVNATGFRVIDNGAYVAAGLPKLQDLMTHEDITLAIYDRETGKAVMTVVGVRPTGYTSGVAARSISDFSASFSGMRASDESGENNEAAGASTLTSGT